MGKNNLVPPVGEFIEVSFTNIRANFIKFDKVSCNRKHLFLFLIRELLLIYLSVWSNQLVYWWLTAVYLGQLDKQRPLSIDWLTESSHIEINEEKPTNHISSWLSVQSVLPSKRWGTPHSWSAHPKKNRQIRPQPIPKETYKHKNPSTCLTHRIRVIQKLIYLRVAEDSVALTYSPEHSLKSLDFHTLNEARNEPEQQERGIWAWFYNSDVILNTDLFLSIKPQVLHAHAYMQWDVR